MKPCGLLVITRGLLMKAGRRAATGLTLIETMVALLVLSVGMLGIAALHGQALRASGTAVNRSMAIDLAGNMADRIRANRTARTAYMAAANDNSCDDSTVAIDCSPAEMAANDLYLWETEIARSLPAGTGQVAVDVGSDPTRYTVSVSWDEPAEANPVTHSIDFQLQAY